MDPPVEYLKMCKFPQIPPFSRDVHIQKLEMKYAYSFARCAQFFRKCFQVSKSITLNSNSGNNKVHFQQCFLSKRPCKTKKGDRISEKFAFATWTKIHTLGFTCSPGDPSICRQSCCVCVCVCVCVTKVKAAVRLLCISHVAITNLCSATHTRAKTPVAQPLL